MRAVFLDFGTVSHDDLDTTQLERVLPGITLHATSTDAEVDERIAGVEFILTNKLNISRARMRAVPGLRFIGLTSCCDGYFNAACVGPEAPRGSRLGPDGENSLAVSIVGSTSTPMKQFCISSQF